MTARLFLTLVVVVSTTLGHEHGKHECERTCEYPAQTKTCHYNFEVQWYMVMSTHCEKCLTVPANCSNPGCVVADGYQKAFMSVNRQLPGPTIRVCYGDTIVVKVTNLLEGGEGLAVHWHGLFQRNTPHMDGAHQTTQCGIQRGSSFTYKVLAEPAGTHWWHAHAGVQRGEGVAGALIIDPPAQENVHLNNYDIDSTKNVLFLSDWHHKSLIESMVIWDQGIVQTLPSSIIVNGKSTREKTSCTDDHEKFFNTYEIESGKRSRFRTISNAGHFCPIEISVDDHMLTVIASDGADFEPYEVTNLVVRAGERYDFVINGNQPSGNYWFRIVGYGDCTNLCQYDYLNYKGFDPKVVPTSNAWVDNSVLYKQLNPINIPEDEQHIYVSSLNAKYSKSFPEDTSLYGTPDDVYFVGADIDQFTSKIVIPPVLLNNVWNKITSSPILTQPEDIGSVCNPEDPNFRRDDFCENGFCHCTHLIDVELGKLVELVIIENNKYNLPSSHVMHLHGQHMTLVSMQKVNQSLTNDEMKQFYNNKNHVYKFDKPIRKDTIAMPSGGYAILRFRADNPGVWMLHCHVLHHLVSGMSLSIRVGYPNDIPQPPKNFPRCGSWEPSDEEEVETTTPSSVICPTSSSRFNHANGVLIFLLCLHFIIFY